MRLSGIASIVVCLFAAGPASGQDFNRSEWAWTTILEQDGVRLSYIFYREADNVNNGVVLRLDNKNDARVRYSFTAIFRAEAAETEEEVEGEVGPQTLVTGDVEGLFFIPFTDGRSIAEIGVRGFRIERIEL